VGLRKSDETVMLARHQIVITRVPYVINTVVKNPDIVVI
jgi:hypothetical protein